MTQRLFNQYLVVLGQVSPPAAMDKKKKPTPWGPDSYQPTRNASGTRQQPGAMSKSHTDLYMTSRRRHWRKNSISFFFSPNENVKLFIGGRHRMINLPQAKQEDNRDWKTYLSLWNQTVWCPNISWLTSISWSTGTINIMEISPPHLNWRVCHL